MKLVPMSTTKNTSAESESITQSRVKCCQQKDHRASSEKLSRVQTKPGTSPVSARHDGQASYCPFSEQAGHMKLPQRAQIACAL